MMRIKSSTAATAAFLAIFGFTALAPSSAQADPRADPRHWFYDNYDGYDDRAYYDGDDRYYVYAPPPRRTRPNQWQRRQDRLRRWANKQARKALRREIRKNRARSNRQRLYDAWQDDQYGRYKPPHRDTVKRVKKAKPHNRVKLARIPLPRTKPYNLIPPQMAALDPAATTAPAAALEAPLGTDDRKIKKFTLDSATNPIKLDERPVWKATPDKKPTSKKGIDVAALPKVITPTLAKPKMAKPKMAKPKIEKTETSTAFKPIRIEVVKDPRTAGFRQPRKPAQRLASNQLSCDKAKSIVSGFGFSDITARTCTGTVYDFNAKRDGKPYSVKVSSLSGELKGVKKIK